MSGESDTQLVAYTGLVFWHSLGTMRTLPETSKRILIVTTKVFLVSLGCSLLAAAPIVKAQTPLMPLTEGSKWTLQNAASSIVTVSVDQERTINGIKFVKWTIAGPWGQFPLLLSVIGNDINLEGMQIGDFAYRYASSTPLFPSTFTPGQSWPTALGTVTAVAGNVPVVTKNATYTNCYSFRWNRPDSSSQSWIVCPTVGPASYTDASGTYTLTKVR